LKLLDLGLARLTDSDAVSASTKHTQPGVVLGSLDYVAPEQANESSAAGREPTMSCIMVRIGGVEQ